MSLPARQSTVPTERRSGVPRRRPEPPDVAGVYRPEDRRLGLGRRWEDWCRPAGQAPSDGAIEYDR